MGSSVVSLSDSSVDNSSNKLGNSESNFSITESRSESIILSILFSSILTEFFVVVSSDSSWSSSSALGSVLGLVLSTSWMGLICPLDKIKAGLSSLDNNFSMLDKIPEASEEFWLRSEAPSTASSTQQAPKIKFCRQVPKTNPFRSLHLEVNIHFPSLPLTLQTFSPPISKPRCSGNMREKRVMRISKLKRVGKVSSRADF